MKVVVGQDAGVEVEVEVEVTVDIEAEVGVAVGAFAGAVIVESVKVLRRKAETMEGVALF